MEDEMKRLTVQIIERISITHALKIKMIVCLKHILELEDSIGFKKLTFSLAKEVVQKIKRCNNKNKMVTYRGEELGYPSK